MPWSSRPYGRQQSSADSTLTADSAAASIDSTPSMHIAAQTRSIRAASGCGTRLALPPGRPANGRREAALGLRGVPSLRVQSSGEHGDVRIVLDLGVLLEARDPLHERLVAAVVVQVRSDRLDELGHVSGICPRAGVAKSPLGLAVRLEPGSRPPLEVTRERRLLLARARPSAACEPHGGSGTTAGPGRARSGTPASPRGTRACGRSRRARGRRRRATARGV